MIKVNDVLNFYVIGDLFKNNLQIEISIKQKINADKLAGSFYIKNIINNRVIEFINSEYVSCKLQNKYYNLIVNVNRNNIILHNYRKIKINNFLNGLS